MGPWIPMGSTMGTHGLTHLDPNGTYRAIPVGPPYIPVLKVYAGSIEVKHKYTVTRSLYDRFTLNGIRLCSLLAQYGGATWSNRQSIASACLMKATLG